MNEITATADRLTVVRWDRITATRTTTEIEIAVNGEVVDTLTGKATIARPFVAVGFGRIWTESGEAEGWKSTSHKSFELALKAKSGNVHFDSKNFEVIEVR